MSDPTHFPLCWPHGWPRTPDDNRRKLSQFSMGAERSRKALRSELRLLGADNLLISSNMPVRLDGTPYADAARRIVRDPGVAVYFTLRGASRVMARDLFWRAEDNLRSIGLAIESMRGLERHGGAFMMERAFEGFAALPAPDSARHWSDVLGVARTASEAEIEIAWRRKVKDAHPDRGGSHDEMAALNAARDEALRERAMA